MNQDELRVFLDQYNTEMLSSDESCEEITRKYAKALLKNFIPKSQILDYVELDEEGMIDIIGCNADPGLQYYTMTKNEYEGFKKIAKALTTNKERIVRVKE